MESPLHCMARTHTIPIFTILISRDMTENRDMTETRDMVETRDMTETCDMTLIIAI